MKIEDVPNFDELNVFLEKAKEDDEVLRIPDIVSNIKISGDRFSSDFKILDDAMKGGFKEGDLVIISGVSGEGKTTFSQTLTHNLTKKSIPCLWFSYEVVIEELNQKFLEMGIEEHYFAYSPKVNTTGKLEWIEQKIKEAWYKYACKVVFIDHIDFLTPLSVKDSDTRETALKLITTQLKSLAIQLRVVIVLMAHLKKLPDNKKEPDMQDIGYSAGIFQLADYVFMVSREKLNKRDANANNGMTATNNSIIRIVKNRQTGTLCFTKLNYSNGKLNTISNIPEPEEPIERNGNFYF